MSQNSTFLQILSISIDAKTAATTTIDTTENGNRRFVPLSVVLEITAQSVLIAGPSISIGTNAGVDNILAITTTGLTATNAILAKVPLGNASTVSVPANTAISVKVTTGATATSATLRVDLIGYYQS